MRERNEDLNKALKVIGLNRHDLRVIEAITSQNFDRYELDAVCLKFGIGHKMSEAISIQEANEAEFKHDRINLQYYHRRFSQPVLMLP